MIPSIQEIVYRLYGTWQLARLNAAGARYFEESPQAALRSFFAAVLVAPAFALTLLLTRDKAPTEDPLEVVLVVLLGYTVAWTAYPVIAYRICLAIDREQDFFRYLCADNWSSVIGYHFQLVVVALIVGGVVPAALAPLVGLAMHACLLIYSWFIVRSCLNVSGVVSAGLVALQLVVGLLIQLLVDNIVYPQGS